MRQMLVEAMLSPPRGKLCDPSGKILSFFLVTLVINISVMHANCTDKTITCTSSIPVARKTPPGTNATSGAGGGREVSKAGNPVGGQETANNVDHGDNQHITLDDLHNFRLEYNKYKILSHLSITDNPDQLAPRVNDDLKRELASLTAIVQRDDERSQASRRHKRSLACDQVRSDKDACCLETFYVNFTYIGWDKWILYPAGYNANYCRGQCDLSHARYYHSTLLSKYSNVISLCCSPKQMAPLRLLYIDEDNKVHQKSIPDMIVEGCDCA